MADRDSQLTLSYQLDKAKAAQVLKYTQDLRSSIRDQAAEIKKLSLTSSGLTNDYAKLSAKTAESRNEFLKGTKAASDQITVLQRLAKARADADNAGSGGGGAGGGSTGVSTIRRAASTASAVGSVLTGLGAGDAGKIGQIAGQIGQAINQFDQLQGVLTTLAPVEGAAEAGAVGMTAALGPLAIAAGVVAVGVIALNAALEDGRKATEARIAAEKEVADVTTNGTATQIKAAREQATEEAKSANIRIQYAQKIERDIESRYGGGKGSDFDKFLLKVVNPEGYKAAAEAEDEAKQALNEASEKQNQYTDALRRGAGAVAEAKAAAEAYAGTFSTGPTLAAQIETARQGEATALQQMADARTQEAEQELTILQNAADQRVKIAEDEAANEAKALVDMQRANAEAGIKLDQQESDDKLAYQRQETEAAKQHARTMLKIQKDEQSSEVDLIAARDFAGLAAARRGLVQKLADEQDSYADSKRQRLDQLKQKLGDDDKGFIRERQARQRAEQLQIQDLRAAEKKQLDDLHASTQKQITALQDKLKAEENTLQARYTTLSNQEVSLFNLRNKLLAGEIDAVAAAAQDKSIMSQVSGSHTPATTYNPNGMTVGTSVEHHYASGGSYPAGQLSMLNERPGQIESLMSGGRSIALPYGAGMFMPFKAGRVNPGGGSTFNFNPTFQGSTWSELKRNAHAMLDTGLAQFARQLTA